MIAQYVLNGFVSGMILALPAIGLTLVYGILKFPNFAFGAMMTAGAYIALILNVNFGLSLLWSAALAAVIFAMIAVVIDQAVFRQLRDRDSITLLVCSMGVSFVLENIARFIFGNAARSFDLVIARPKYILGLKVNNEQIITAIIALSAMAAVYFILRHTALGRAMRAVADNPALAAVRGVRRENIICWTWVIAGSLTAIAGVLAGMDRAIDPMLGWNYIVSTFAAAILGGLGNPVGAVIGALAVGIVEETSTLIIPPNYRQAMSFLVIALLLLMRPQGLLGVATIKK